MNKYLLLLKRFHIGNTEKLKQKEEQHGKGDYLKRRILSTRIRTTMERICT
jgi:hypothetical protein